MINVILAANGFSQSCDLRRYKLGPVYMEVGDPR